MEENKLVTPKIKAEELVDRYNKLIDHQDHYWGVPAKEAVLILVGELIEHLPSADGNPPNLPMYAGNKEWWEEVRKELNKL